MADRFVHEGRQKGMDITYNLYPEAGHYDIMQGAALEDTLRAFSAVTGAQNQLRASAASAEA